MLRWRKRGIIYNPCKEKERPYWKWNFAQGQNVLIFEDRIRVYFCTREKTNEKGLTVSRVGYIDLDKKDLKKIIGKSSKPVIELGELGTFDQHGMYPFSPIKIKDEVYGYYGGITRCESVPFNVSIGVVISKNRGESFERIDKGPVLSYSLEEPFVVCSPKIRIFNGVWYMTYSAGKIWTKEEDNRAEICYKLRMAKSIDGFNWEKMNVNIIDDKLGEYESQACGDIIYKSGKYHMFFCYRHHLDFRKNKNKSYRIGYAYSYDLEKWVRNDEFVGIDISDDENEWDSEMVAYPNVFEVEGKIYMLYLGNEVGKYGFGLAELEGDLL